MARFSSSLTKVLLACAAILVGMTGRTEAAWADDLESASQADCLGDCFVLTSLTIQGVSAYPLADLASTYDDNLARRITVSDLVRTADAITERYRRDGYFLTRAVVAPGDHSGGSAYIVVYEGYLGAVVVEGAGADAVAPLLEPLKDGRALRIAELDRRLSLASDIPGVTLTSRIEPMLDDPSRHTLVVTAELDRVQGGFNIDNRGADAQGPWQAYATASINSAVLAGDRLTVSALTVPEDPDELTFGEIAYSVPLGSATSARIAMSAYSTDAPAGSAGWLNGQSRAASFAVTHALMRSRATSLWATAALDVRKVEQTYRQAGAVEERLTVARATLSARRQAAQGHVAATLQLSRGLDLFDATANPSPQLTRGDATGEFTKISATVTAYRDIGRFAGVYASASAQWSADPLLASEEFYVGGPDVGRAYNYGELGGDAGMAGVVELRLGWDPRPTAVTFAQGYAFLDAGRVSNRAPTGDVHADLASFGVGTRITFQDRATLKVELAKPLADRPYAEPDNGWRLFVGLSRQF